MAGVPVVIITGLGGFADGPEHPASATAAAMRSSITAREDTFIVMDYRQFLLKVATVGKGTGGTREEDAVPV
jgi:hypothetical protein